MPLPAIKLPASFNVAEHFFRPLLAGEVAPGPYLTCGGQTLTTHDAWAQSVRLGRALRRMGVEPENRVMLLMDESLAVAPCFWGTLLVGAVCVPVNPGLTPAEHRQILAESRAKVLIADGAAWCGIAPYRGDLRHLRHVVTVGGGHADLPALERILAPTENEGNAPHPAQPMHPDDAAFWLYTSGSTGAPKAAVHLHKDPVYAVARYAKAVLGLTPEDKGLSAARMCFAYGMGNSLFFPLATGGTGVIHPDPPTGEALLAALARHRPTVFYGVPTHFRAILDAWPARPKAGRGIQHTALHHLRFSVSAGEALPAQTAIAWRETFGSEILDSMGSTEMLTFFIANRPGRSRPGNVGTPVPGFSVRLVDGEGRDVPPGEPGSLRVKGETAAARYWNRRALTRATMLGEWIVTGDRLVQEQDGSYRYLGRDDDMFKVGGSWVSPMEVESALMTHPDVAECAVVGKPGPHGLNRAEAYVVPARNRPVPEVRPEKLSEELRQHVADRIAAFKVPETITLVPRLPRTPTGKVRRFQLRG